MSVVDYLFLQYFNANTDEGFSLGGMIVQKLAHDHPEMLRRIILLGTGPRGGEGMTFTELSVEEQADPVRFLLDAFLLPPILAKHQERRS